MVNAKGLTVLYDGGCSLCAREIVHYRRLESLISIAWIDITRDPDKLHTFGLDFPTVMAEFHVIDQDGRLYKGADGFLKLWSELPYYRYLSFFCRALALQGLMHRYYSRFARWHFLRRCPDGVCSAP
jgi:predicted DCC family thiol-disulfide oxidoreductase YuxK